LFHGSGGNSRAENKQIRLAETEAGAPFSIGLLLQHREYVNTRNEQHGMFTILFDYYTCVNTSRGTSRTENREFLVAEAGTEAAPHSILLNSIGEHIQQQGHPSKLKVNIFFHYPYYSTPLIMYSFQKSNLARMRIWDADMRILAGFDF